MRGTWILAAAVSAALAAGAPAAKAADGGTISLPSAANTGMGALDKLGMKKGTADGPAAPPPLTMGNPLLNDGPAEFQDVPGMPHVPVSERGWRRESIGMARASGLDKTALCGCAFDGDVFSKTYTGIDPRSCGYSPRRPTPESRRVAPGRVVPDKDLVRGRPCLTLPSSTYLDAKGSPIDPVAYCVAHDDKVKAMRNDLFNSYIEVEEVVAETAGRRQAAAPAGAAPFGTCPVKIDTTANLVEPPDKAKGRIARAWLYMSDMWGVQISPADLDRYRAWHQEHPPTKDELEFGYQAAIRQGMEDIYLPVPEMRRQWLPKKIDQRFADPNAK